MIHTYDEGLLQAYLDEALDAEEQANVAAHLVGCAECRGQLDELRTLAAKVGRLLAVPVPVADPRTILAQVRSGQGDPQSDLQRRKAARPQAVGAKEARGQAVGAKEARAQAPAALWWRSRRPLLARLALVLVALSLLGFPPVRAAADQFLQVFRVQTVVFVPVSPDRVEQLKKLNFDAKTLFVTRPALVNTPAAPRIVSDIGAAASIAGFTPQSLTVFPSALNSTQIIVHDRSIYQTQVNVQSVRQLLTLLNITDVAIPDALGSAPLKADLAPYVESRYRGRRSDRQTDYQLTLYQGRSPNVTLPAGVNLSQMGRAVLRLLGMSPAQADTLSRQIDWRSTFIFPFPDQVNEVRQIPINGTQGLLVDGSKTSAKGSDKSSQNSVMLYWQQGDRFYMLEGTGSLSQSDLIASAQSIR